MYNITQIHTLLVFPFTHKIQETSAYPKWYETCSNDLPNCPRPASHHLIPVSSCISTSSCVTTAVIEVVLLHSEIWTSWEVTQKWSWHGIKRHIHFNYVAVDPGASAAAASWLSAATCLSLEEHPAVRMDLQNVLSNARGSCWNGFISIKTILLNIFEVSLLYKTDAKLSYIKSAACFTQ